MQYRSYGKQGFEVSALGMGCMRLPRIYTPGKDTAEVDVEKAVEIIRYAADHGVNYFDSALTYHHQKSEEVLGLALEGGYRKRVKIATKQMLPFMKTSADIRRNLENTLEKLRTDYLDAYLVHNIHAGSWDEIKRRDIYGEYVKLRDEGLIRAIGFSYHGKLPCFKAALEEYPWDMCQIQQNILDVESEATQEAIALAGKKGTALVIMEPLRGGGLVQPAPSVQAVYDAHPVKRPPVEWAFRHLLNYKEVSCILSGMTSLEQLKENIEIFSKADALPGCLSNEDKAMIREVRLAYEALAAIPCTGCEYCMPCPNNVNIPGVFGLYNEGVMCGQLDQPKRAYMFLGRAGQHAAYCVECGQCEKNCPQAIPIIQRLRTAHEKLDGWIE